MSPTGQMKKRKKKEIKKFPRFQSIAEFYRKKSIDLKFKSYCNKLSLLQLNLYYQILLLRYDAAKNTCSKSGVAITFLCFILCSLLSTL